LKEELADATINSQSEGKRPVAIRRYIGGTAKKHRTQISNAFSAAEVNVLVTSRVIAVGVDGLQDASTLVFNFVPWTYADYLQVVGRVVRLPSCKNKPSPVATVKKKLVYQGRLKLQHPVTGKPVVLDQKRWAAVGKRKEDLSRILDGQYLEVRDSVDKHGSASDYKMSVPASSSSSSSQSCEVARLSLTVAATAATAATAAAAAAAATDPVATMAAQAESSTRSFVAASPSTIAAVQSRPDSSRRHKHKATTKKTKTKKRRKPKTKQTG
jgi:superfamily II DNA or RNA helicase